MSTISNLDNPTLTNMFLTIPKYLRNVRLVCKKFQEIIQNNDLCRFLVEKKNPTYINLRDGSVMKFVPIQSITHDFIDCVHAISNKKLNYLIYLNEHNYINNENTNGLMLASIGCHAFDCYKYFIETKKQIISQQHLMNAIIAHSFECCTYIIENIKKPSHISDELFYFQNCHIAICNNNAEGFKILYKKYCQYGGESYGKIIGTIICQDSVDCLKYLCEVMNENNIEILPNMFEDAHDKCQDFLFMWFLNSKK